MFSMFAVSAGQLLISYFQPPLLIFTNLLQRIIILWYLYFNINSQGEVTICTKSSFVSRKSLTLAAAAAHPLELEVSWCRTSQFARCFLAPQDRMWNNLPNTVQDTATLDWLRVQSTVGCFPELWVLEFSVEQVLVGLRMPSINIFVFSALACAPSFNNNINDKKNNI